MTVKLIDQPVHGYGPFPRSTRASFAPNGTSDPVTANNHGPPGVKNFTTVYAATGQYTITFPVDFAPPASTIFIVSAQCADLTNYFEVVQIGAYDAVNRVLVIQAKRAAAGNAPAAAAGCRIHIGMIFNDSTGG